MAPTSTRAANINLTLHELYEWLNDSSKIDLFEPLAITSRTDIPNWLYPINYKLKNQRKIRVYGQRIKGITAYYVDSLHSFYSLYIYTNDKSGKIIHDSLHKTLGNPNDPGGVIIDGVLMRLGNITTWVDSNYNDMLIQYFPKDQNAYEAGFFNGYKYKYFDWSNYVEITNRKLMSTDFYINRSWNKVDKNNDIGMSPPPKK